MGLLETLMPRRFHAYCSGLGKTGTHSVAQIFANYRSGHESDAKTFVPVQQAYAAGEISTDAFRRELRRRDWRLWLEMDSGGVDPWFVDDLIAIFPAMQFIHPIREPFSWTESFMDHFLNGRVHGETEAWQRHIWNRNAFDYTPSDGPLEALGLHPLAAYFWHWSNHNQRVIETVPEDQLLVIRTSEIRDRIGDIAAFLGAPEDTLDAGAAWAYRTPTRHGTLAQLAPEYVRDTAAPYIGDLVDRFFPDLPAYGEE